MRCELLALVVPRLRIESRDEDGPAGIEWLLPTAVILFIGKAYIDGLVKERLERSLHPSKQGLKSLCSRALLDPSTNTHRHLHRGKIEGSRRALVVVLLLAEAPDGLRPLLIKSAATQEEQ